MKANSNIRPRTLIDLGNGRFHYNYNIVETVDEDGQMQYDYDYVETDSATYGDIVTAIIREKYPLDAELALVNNYNLYLSSGDDETHREEYLAFLEFRTEVKRVVKEGLANI